VSSEDKNGSDRESAREIELFPFLKESGSLLLASVLAIASLIGLALNLDTISQALGPSVSFWTGVLAVVASLLFILSIWLAYRLIALSNREARERERELEDALRERERALEDKVRQRKQELEDRMREREDALKAELDRRRQQVDAYTDTLRKIVRKLYPAQESPPYRLDRADYRITVEENGDVRIRREEHIRATTPDPLHYFTVWIHADDGASRVESFEEINFRAEDVGPNEAMHLPLEDNPRKKKVAVFLLPRAQETEETPRKIITTYEWPSYMWGLSEKGQDEWTYGFKRSVEAVDEIRFTFDVHEALGRIGVEYLGPPLANDFITDREHVPGDYQRVSLSASEAPGSDFEYPFRLVVQDG
jgi:type III secretory pathway component EscS